METITAEAEALDGAARRKARKRLDDLFDKDATVADIADDLGMTFGRNIISGMDESVFKAHATANSSEVESHLRDAVLALEILKDSIRTVRKELRN